MDKIKYIAMSRRCEVHILASEVKQVDLDKLMKEANETFQRFSRIYFFEEKDGYVIYKLSVRLRDFERKCFFDYINKILHLDFKLDRVRAVYNRHPKEPISESSTILGYHGNALLNNFRFKYK